eukprot:gnl/MRDRNA2_/MRDRNA2_110216_c0_seq1.p1 gnl/MRDRNA2_/MRDRNA2_110216_c0~~gnl/MRDRNA2_/MRDRNA2_110216_c0_seq1.p1  ORF type:complete len:1850 (+),score=498.85 gnl/MRDRNA2_/MRDRNA2_110216_c0_seq1:562-5550(+)
MQDAMLSATVVAQLKAELERTKGELAKVQELGGLSTAPSAAKSYCRTYKAGEAIVSEGEDAAEMYIINSGTVSVEVNGTELMEKHEGDIFGEQAVLGLANKRTATVRAKGGEVEVRVLTREVFTYSADYVMDMKQKFDETLELLQQYEMSWEERCEREEGHQRERRKTLADLGLVVAFQKRRNAVPDLVIPYMKNISSDPSLCGTLLYTFDAQEDSTVGSGSQCKIKLSGLGIKPFMFQITNKDDMKVTLSTKNPFQNAVRNAMQGALPRILINGKALREEAVELRHGDRLIVGHAFCFHMQIPQQRIEERAHQRASQRQPAPSELPFDVKDGRKISFSREISATSSTAEDLDDSSEGQSEVEDNVTLEDALDEVRQGLSEACADDEDQPLYVQYVKGFEKSMDKESYMWLMTAFEEAHTLCEEANELSKELRPDNGFVFTAQIVASHYDASIQAENKHELIVKQFQTDNMLSHDREGDDVSGVFRGVGVFDIFEFKDRLEAMRECYHKSNFLQTAAIHKHSHDPWAVIGYHELQQIVAEVAQKQWESMEQTMSWINKSSANNASIIDQVGKSSSDVSDNDSQESDEELAENDQLSLLPTFAKAKSDGSEKKTTAPQQFTSLRWMVGEQKRRMSQLVDELSSRRASALDIRSRSYSLMPFADQGADRLIFHRHQSMLTSNSQNQPISTSFERSRAGTGHFGGSDMEDVNLSDQESDFAGQRSEIGKLRAEVSEQTQALQQNDKDIQLLLNEESAFAEECEELKASEIADVQELQAQIMEQREELLENAEDIETLLAAEASVETQLKDTQAKLNQLQQRRQSQQENGHMKVEFEEELAAANELRQELEDSVQDVQTLLAEEGELAQECSDQKAFLVQNEEDIETLLHEEGVVVAELSTVKEQNRRGHSVDVMQECQELRSELADVMNDFSEAQFSSASTVNLTEQLDELREELEASAQDIDALLGEENVYSEQCEELRDELANAQEGRSIGTSNERINKSLVDENKMLRAELSDANSIDLRNEVAEQRQELLENEQDIEALLHEETEYAETCEELRVELLESPNNIGASNLREELVEQKTELQESAHDIEILLTEEGAYAEECMELHTELDEAHAGILPPPTVKQEKLTKALRKELELAEEEIHDQQEEIFESYEALQSMGTELADASEELAGNAQDFDLLIAEEEKAEFERKEFHAELEEVMETSDSAKKSFRSGSGQDKLRAELADAEAENRVQSESLEEAEQDIEVLLGAETSLTEQHAEVREELEKAISTNRGTEEANSELRRHLEEKLNVVVSEREAARNVVSEKDRILQSQELVSLKNRNEILEKELALSRQEAAKTQVGALERSEQVEDLLKLRSELRISLGEAREARNARSKACEELLKIREELSTAQNETTAAREDTLASQAHLTEELLRVKKLCGTEERLRSELNEAFLNARDASKSAEDVVQCLEQSKTYDLNQELNVALAKSSLHVSAYLRLDRGLRDAFEELEDFHIQGTLLPGVVQAISRFRTVIRESLDALVLAGFGGELPGSDMTASAILRDELRTIVTEAGEERTIEQVQKQQLDSEIPILEVGGPEPLPPSFVAEPVSDTVQPLEEYEYQCKWLPEFEEKASALLGSLRMHHVAAAEGVRGVASELGRLRTKVKSAKSLVVSDEM